MKHSIHTIYRCFPVFLVLLAVMLASCAQFAEQEETQDGAQYTPANADGTCYTQTVPLPDSYYADSRRTPYFCVTEERVVVSNIMFSDTDAHAYVPDADAVVLIWDLRQNTLETVPIQPIFSATHHEVSIHTHLPTEDGGAVQLLAFSFDPASYFTPEDPEYSGPIEQKLYLASADKNGNTHFTCEIGTLTGNPTGAGMTLSRDRRTGRLFISDVGSDHLWVVETDGTVKDPLPLQDSLTAIQDSASGEVLFCDRFSGTEWQYFRYDADAHALVPSASVQWTGYAIHPLNDTAWYEHTARGMVLREKTDSGSRAETLMCDWVKSGYTDASIRNTYVSAGTESLRIVTVTANSTTGQYALTLFEPEREWTVSKKHEIRLFAPDTAVTLQDAVVNFNTTNGLYRVSYTDNADDADVLYANLYSALPQTVPLRDLYPHLSGDAAFSDDTFVGGVLDAFTTEDGALEILCARFAVCAVGPEDYEKSSIMTSATDWMYLSASYAAEPEDAELLPVIGFAIPEHCEDPDAAWKFIRNFMQYETAETLSSGADEGFSSLSVLFDGQLDRMNGAYAAVREAEATYAYPRGDAEFDPMTNVNFAAAVNSGAAIVCFDADSRAALETLIARAKQN